MRLECLERFLRHRLQSKTQVSDPGMHHGTCVTHVPWCMSGSLIGDGRENVPSIPGACATCNFTYLTRGPWGKRSSTVAQSLKWWSSYLDLQNGQLRHQWVSGPLRDGPSHVRLVTNLLLDTHYSDVIIKHDCVSNHQRLDCLLNCLSKRGTSKLHVTGLCEGNPPLTSGFPAQRASNPENVSISWRHHVQEHWCIRCTYMNIMLV